MSNSTSGKNNGPLVVTLVLVILIGLSIAVYFTFFAKVKPKSVAAPVATTAPVTTTAPVVEPVEAQPRMLGVHLVVPRDTLWWISDKWYKDPILWPSIYEINLNQIKNPDMIFPGQKFQIPALKGSIGHLAQDDYSLLAKGYLEAYRVYQENGKKDAKAYQQVGDRYQTKATK